MVHSANNTQGLVNLTEFQNLPDAKHYFIAFSGGKDSTALLHGLSRLPQLLGRLTAIHVNHNINPQSANWAAHCQSVCKTLKIPLITAAVELDDHSESACRQARHKVFSQHLNTGDCLMTAHHLNDQVETILFRLIRGTGLHGLTGMAATNEFDHYRIHRPLLSLSQNKINTYVDANQLSYVDDPSNLDNHYSRNYIRNVIIPELEKYDPHALQQLCLTADNLHQSEKLLNHLMVNNNPMAYQGYTDTSLLSTALYHWLNNNKVQVPNRKCLNQFSQDCLLAAADKNPELILEGCQLVRWQGHIYRLKLTPKMDANDFIFKLSSDTTFTTLPDNSEIEFKALFDVSLNAVIKYQQSHEKIKINENGQHKKLKNLFQQLGIPPWERLVIPYLYINNQLMAVGSDILSSEFKQLLSEYKAEYRWLSSQYIL